MDNWKKEFAKKFGKPMPLMVHHAVECFIEKAIIEAIKEDRKKDCECTEEETTGATTEYMCHNCRKIQSKDNG